MLGRSCYIVRVRDNTDDETLYHIWSNSLLPQVRFGDIVLGSVRSDRSGSYLVGSRIRLYSCAMITAAPPITVDNCSSLRWSMPKVLGHASGASI